VIAQARPTQHAGTRKAPEPARLLAGSAHTGHYALVPDQTATGQARLTAEYRETHDGHVWLSSVVLLVGDEDVFATIGSGGYIGLTPSELSRQSALIEPGESPSEVLLYRCSCGETGCAAVVARCYRVRDDVVWDRFDSGNTPPVDVDSPRPAPDALRFDAEQYEAFTSRIRELASRHPDVR
jgi:hypothetical protein